MPAVIETYELTKRYGKARGIESLSLSIPNGGAYGFLGPNGAGKTTTIRCILGLLRPTRGQVLLFGGMANRSALHSLVGYVAGDVNLFPKETGRWHIRFFEKLRRQRATSAYEIASHLELDLSRKVHHLSKGNRQKLALVLALMHDPALLILDEPTSGLDPLAQEAVFGIIKERIAAGSTLFLSSHILSEVERVCSDVVIIKEGRLVAQESMDALMRRRLRDVSILFKEPVNPESFSRVPGIRNVRFLSSSQVKAQVSSEGLNALIGLVSFHPVLDLEIQHASLEDIFMDYYRPQGVGSQTMTQSISLTSGQGSISLPETGRVPDTALKAGK
jgi:ABC-2 type transport system ATP-binding protein